jgi:hypothetical protein
MIKAIISNGVIVPRDPLPADWQEGTEVAVERFPGDVALTKDGSCTDVWMDEVEAIARQGNPQDEQRLDAAILEIHRREKNLARTKLGDMELVRQAITDAAQN